MRANSTLALGTIDYRVKSAPIEFTRSLSQSGFAVFSNSPIADSLVQATYQEWTTFFDSDYKQTYQFDPQRQSGYFPMQSEQAKDHCVPDLKEFFHLYEWTELPISMTDCTWQLFDQLRQLAAELLCWIEDQTPLHIRQCFSQPLSEMIAGSQSTLMRPIHYPPLPAAVPPDAIRAAAHEDINLITLLPAATAMGLQIQDNQGNWHDVPGDCGDLVVNVGDMLQLATQGYYRSTTHRVANPQGSAAQYSRLSMPLFLHPRPEVVLAGNITAYDYLQERLGELGLLK
jgi:isopenicillin N synthase-like dioxygenase